MASKSAKRGGLGRGLGSLIPTAPPPPPSAPSAAPTAAPRIYPSWGGPGATATTAVASENTPSVAQDSASADAPATTRPTDAEPTTESATAASEHAAPSGAPETESGQASGAPESAASQEESDAAGEAPAVGVSADDGVPAVGAGPAHDDGLQPVAGATFAELDVTAIRTNPKQPRQVFDEEALEELAHSVREFGVLQPIVVRPLSEDEHDGDIRYELVMGERRLRAVTAAGLTVVPAIVRSTADDAMLRDALLENLHRVQLNPLEEASAYQQLLEEFGATHDELAHRIGRSRSQVSNTIRLLNLPVAVQRRVAAGVLSAGHARALLGLDEREAQDELAGRIVAEGLSVRATEELVALAAQGHGPKAARRQKPKFTAPKIAELSESLSDRFDTRVLVDIGRRKGKLTIEFGSIDDLERIVGMIAPDLATRRPSAE